MPLPQEHLVGLQEHVESLERRLAELRHVIRVAQEETDVNEALLGLARNERLIALVGQMYDDSGLSSKFARDPLTYARKEKIEIPEGVTLNAVDEAGRSTRLTANLRRGAWDVEVVWDRDGGFSARPRTPPEVVGPPINSTMNSTTAE